jgi:adenine phosphoribosyltransferase
MDLKALIRTIPDFPKPGILFYDISTLLEEAAGLQVAIDRLATLVEPFAPERLAAIESRGFLLGAPLAMHLGIGLSMVRKRGKLPGSVVGHSYDLEYGEDQIEVSADLIPKGSRVVVIDDLIATGGTVAAAIELLRKVGANPVAAAFLIELADLKGREKLGVEVRSLLTYDI